MAPIEFMKAHVRACVCLIVSDDTPSIRARFPATILSMVMAFFKRFAADPFVAGSVETRAPPMITKSPPILSAVAPYVARLPRWM